MTEAYVIHLHTSTERVPLIEKLVKETGLIIQTYFASNGSDTWNDASIPKKHPWKYSQLTQGMVGCTESHLGVLQYGADMPDLAPFFIFEDDAELLAPFEEVQEFVDSIEGSWDIILLGANEYVEFVSSENDYHRINRFWGTHAMLINPKCCAKIMATFEEMKRGGVFPPPDWMYNEAIKQKRLCVYAPVDPERFFRQKKGLISLLTGNVR